jgi:hypothetical protein
VTDGTERQKGQRAYVAMKYVYVIKPQFKAVQALMLVVTMQK